ncbi:YidH family protein [Gordonia sp. GN26]
MRSRRYERARALTTERTNGPADGAGAGPGKGAPPPAAPSAAPPGAVDARFTLAAERTLLAWVRTALGFMAAGMAIVYLAPDIDNPVLELVLGLVLVALGCSLAVIGAWRWRRTLRVLQRGGQMPGPAQVLFVVTAIVVVAILIAVVVVIQA